LAISRGEQVASAWIVVLLSFYLLAVRLSLCRVETQRHRPCRWRVRGLLGSCDCHLGLKRGLPRLVHVGGFRLPALMWPRYDLAMAVSSEPQPPNGVPDAAQVAPRARRSWQDNAMLWLAVGSIVVALASFVRDVVAG
jgi:hypothetical protein